MAGNSLKAAISENLDKQEKKKPVSTVAKQSGKGRATSTKAKAPSRSNTVLIGGHFAPEVKQQLRLIAAEEGSTSQALLQEALDLLFVKKGKSKIY